MLPATRARWRQEQRSLVSYKLASFRRARMQCYANFSGLGTVPMRRISPSCTVWWRRTIPQWRRATKRRNKLSKNNRKPRRRERDLGTLLAENFCRRLLRNEGQGLIPAPSRPFKKYGIVG